MEEGTTADSDWLLTRLSLTYYEQCDYERSLRYSEKAFVLAPRCPLVIWDYAGTLEMLGEFQKAADFYHRLIRRGVPSLAYDECGEGMARARGLVADCWHRLGHCEAKLGRKAKAVHHLKHHLLLRGRGRRSIYPANSVKRELNAFRS
jgi:tetratricopeptide (TPR) repeat protein